MAIRDALILPGSTPGYQDYRDAEERNALAERQAQQQEENVLYQRQRQQVADERAGVEFNQGQEDRQRTMAAADQDQRAKHLQTIYQITKGITDPQQFEAMKPQLRQIVPDIDGETFDTVQQINQIGRAMEERRLFQTGGNIVSTGPGGEDPREVYRAPEEPPKPPSGYRWNGAKTGVEPIPGYVEGQAQLTGARRQELVSRPMPSRAVATASAGTGGGGSSLTSDTVQQLAEQVVAGGPLPSLGMGKTATAARQQILNRVGEIRKAGGIDGYRAAEQTASYKANAAALSQVSRQRNTIESFEQTAIKNGDLALSLAPKGGGPTGSPVMNRWIQKGRKSVAGDPDVAAFDAALGTFADEYAKIVSGNTGSAGASDSVRAEVHSRINNAMSPAQLRSVISTMKQEMGNRTASLRDQEGQLRSTLGGKPGEAKAPAPAGNVIRYDAKGNRIP